MIISHFHTNKIFLISLLLSIFCLEEKRKKYFYRRLNNERHFSVFFVQENKHSRLSREKVRKKGREREKVDEGWKVDRYLFSMLLFEWLVLENWERKKGRKKKRTVVTTSQHHLPFTDFLLSFPLFFSLVLFLHLFLSFLLFQLFSAIIRSQSYWQFLVSVLLFSTWCTRWMTGVRERERKSERERGKRK